MRFTRRVATSKNTRHARLFEGIDADECPLGALLEYATEVLGRGRVLPDPGHSEEPAELDLTPIRTSVLSHAEGSNLVAGARFGHWLQLVHASDLPDVSR